MKNISFLSKSFILLLLNLLSLGGISNVHIPIDEAYPGNEKLIGLDYNMDQFTYLSSLPKSKDFPVMAKASSLLITPNISKDHTRLTKKVAAILPSSLRNRKRQESYVFYL